MAASVGCNSLVVVVVVGHVISNRPLHVRRETELSREVNAETLEAQADGRRAESL